MEPPEVPTEHLHEHMHEHVHEQEHAPSHDQGHKVKWIMGAALSSALLAALAAVASLLAADNIDDAMIEQIRAADQWNYYQAKGVKAGVLASKMELLDGLDHPPTQKDRKKLADYADEQKDIQDKAKELETSSDRHLHTHLVFARAVTFFQVAIAIAAISVLSHKRPFLFVGLAFGCVGLAFLTQGFLSTMKPEHPPEAHAPAAGVAATNAAHEH